MTEGGRRALGAAGRWLDPALALAERVGLRAVWIGGALLLASAVLVSIDVVIRKLFTVSLGGAAINWVVWYVCFRRFGMHDLLAILVGIAVATAWNFLVNLLWTWRKR